MALTMLMTIIMLVRIIILLCEAHKEGVDYIIIKKQTQTAANDHNRS